MILSVKARFVKAEYHAVKIPELIWQEASSFYRANQNELRERYGIRSTKALIWRATLEYIQQLRQSGLKR